jgi:sugar lactone lactonase YvrE
VFRISQVMLMVVLVLFLGGRPATAASYPTVHTNTGFGLLFVLGSDSRGNLYVADQKHYAILKLSPSGRLVLKDPMPKKCGISGLAASSAGDVYAVANCQGLVYHFSPAGRLMQRFGRQPPGPNGVAVDAQGRVYVTYGSPVGGPPLPPGAPPGAKVQTFANRFVEFTSAGKVMRTVKLAGLHQSWGIALDAGDHVYVTGAEAMVKVSPAGRIVGRWSKVMPVKTKYILPGQPAVDRQGNVYGNDASGDIVKLFAGTPVVGTIVRHGAGPNAVQQPTGLAVANGHLFVGDTGVNRIKEFSLTGKLLAIWSP